MSQKTNVSKNASTVQPKDTTETNLLHRITHGPFLGLIYTFFGSLCTVTSALIVKKMILISPGQLSVVRSVGAITFSIPFVVFIGEKMLGLRIHRRLLVIRAIDSGIAFYPFHMTYRLLPLSEAIIIFSTIPAVVMIGARVFLKESCETVSICAVVLTFLGVILNIRFSDLVLNKDGSRFTVEYVTGLTCAIGGVFCIALNYLTTSKLKDIHFSIMMLHTNIVGAIANSGLTATFSFFDLPQCGWDSILMISLAVSGFAGHCFMTLAIKHEAVGIVSLVRSSLEIVIAFVYQVLFFNSYPDAYSSCGAVMVITSLGLIALNKRLLQLPENSNIRRKLKLMKL